MKRAKPKTSVVQSIRAPISQAVMLALISPAALAQSQEGIAQIEEIIVTSQRRSQNMQSVPISIDCEPTNHSRAEYSEFL